MARVITPPNTQTQSTHAITIHSGRNGLMIGAIHSWAPKQSMGANPVYEFGQVTGPYGEEFGSPYETIPANVTGLTIDVNRYDIYTIQMEQAFGTSRLDMLSSDPGQANGGTGHMDIRERWTTPNNIGNYEIIYAGCWFTSLGRTMTTTDDRIVKAAATLAYTRRFRINS